RSMTAQAGERCLREDVAADDEAQLAPRHRCAGVVDRRQIERVDGETVFVRWSFRRTRTVITPPKKIVVRVLSAGGEIRLAGSRIRRERGDRGWDVVGDPVNEAVATARLVIIENQRVTLRARRRTAPLEVRRDVWATAV